MKKSTFLARDPGRIIIAPKVNPFETSVFETVKQNSHKNLASSFRTANKIRLKINPKRLSSFEEIIQTGGFNYGYDERLEFETSCQKFIFSNVSNDTEEEFVLYWEGKNQSIHGGVHLYEYFRTQGFEVIKKTHASILIYAMRELTENNLSSLGLLPSVDIVLPTIEDSLLLNIDKNKCFLTAIRHQGNRLLGLVDWEGEWSFDYAFLLKEMTKK